MSMTGLQQAIYTRLAGYSALTSLVTGIYARVPQPDDAEAISAFPYVTFHIVTAQPFDTKTDDGFSAVVQVDTWGRVQSRLAFAAIGDAVYDALHKYELVISGANTIAVGMTDRNVLDDPDGVTMREYLQFRVVADEI